MSEVILKFVLPEEQEEADVARKAYAYYGAIEDWTQFLRGKCKYEENQDTTWEDVREAWAKHLSESGIND